MNTAPDTLTWAGRLQVFLPFALGYFLSYLFRVINAVLAPDLVNDIGLDPSQLGLLTGAYFITFAAFQVPLGVLLDRFGPRRIETILLIAAAAGAFVFSRADSLTGLVIGRGLIGLGVSACLMAAFKAFVDWFPRQQLPKVNGFQMAAGGLGALTATAPVQTALAFTDWRGIFSTLAAVTLLTAALIFFVVPARKASSADPGLADQVRGIGRVLGSMTFWRIAPWATFSQAGYLAVHGLWAGPWLRDVAGLDRGPAANILLLVAAAMVAGYIVLGVLAELLSRRGIAPLSVATAGMGVFLFMLLLVTLQVPVAPGLIWPLFGFFGTAGILVYAVLSQSFASHLAGRANTALNLLVFVAAFAFQWGIGAVVELWPVSLDGGYAPAAYQVAFGILTILQVTAAAWFWLAGRLWRGRSGLKASLAAKPGGR